MGNSFKAPVESGVRWEASQRAVNFIGVEKSPNLGAHPNVRDDRGDEVENTTVHSSFDTFNVEWDRESVLRDAIDLALQAINLGKHVGEGINDLVNEVLDALRSHMVPVEVNATK